MKNAMKSTAAAILAVVALSAGHASAASVLVTNATSGWTVTRTTSSAAPGPADYHTFAYDGTPTTTSAVVVTNPDGNWTATGDPRLSAAKWISNNANSNTDTGDPFSTRYTYQTSFNLNTTSILNLTFAGDNIVDRIILSTAPNGGGTVFGTYINNVFPIGDQSSFTGRINGFTLAGIQTYSTIAFGKVFITADVYNYGGNPVPGHAITGSALGFILAVDAIPTVPIPAAFPAGLALIGTLGVMRRVRANGSKLKND